MSRPLAARLGRWGDFSFHRFIQIASEIKLPITKYRRKFVERSVDRCVNLPVFLHLFPELILDEALPFFYILVLCSMFSRNLTTKFKMPLTQKTIKYIFRSMRVLDLK
jgi:hypothetical protein